MRQISGYARILIDHRAQQEATKSFFGKPTLTYGQCFVMSAYFMQLGALLSAKFRTRLTAFWHAFLGATGEDGAMRRFVDSSAPELLALVEDGMTFSDYVMAQQMNRLKYQGESKMFLLQIGAKKLDLVSSTSLVRQFAIEGTILGASDPEVAQILFDNSNCRWNQTEWDRARAAGLNIPEKQDILDWETAQEGENEGFMAYCQQCAPLLYEELSG